MISCEDKIPTVTSIPASLKMSSVGLVTKPEPLEIYQSRVRVASGMLNWTLTASKHVGEPCLSIDGTYRGRTNKTHSRKRAFVRGNVTHGRAAENSLINFSTERVLFARK